MSRFFLFFLYNVPAVIYNNFYYIFLSFFLCLSVRWTRADDLMRDGRSKWGTTAWPLILLPVGPSDKVSSDTPRHLNLGQWKILTRKRQDSPLRSMRKYRKTHGNTWASSSYSPPVTNSSFPRERIPCKQWNSTNLSLSGQQQQEIRRIRRNGNINGYQ